MSLWGFLLPCFVFLNTNDLPLVLLLTCMFNHHMSAELARFSLGSCWLLLTLNFFSADTKPRTKEWYFFRLSRLHAHFGCWFASSLCNEQQGGLQGKKRVLKVVLHKKQMQIQCLWRAVHVPVVWLAFLGRILEEIQPHKHNIVPKHVTLHLGESAGAQNNLGVNKDCGVRRILFFFPPFLRMMWF